MFRLYTGTYVTVYNLNRSGNRCPICTEEFTGAVLQTNCTTCNGTGFETNYVPVGNYWAWVTITPYLNTTDELGNTDNQNSRKLNFYVVDAPIIKDSALIYTVDTQYLYEIVDEQPEIVAINGEIIMQIIQASRVTPGSSIYNVTT